MGFWSTLGKIALPVASVAAAPFTGGTSLLGMLGSAGGAVAKGINAMSPALDAIGKVGGVAAGAAKGGADQRMLQDQLALQHGQLQQGAARDQFSAGMQGAQFQREGQDRERKQAILAQLLGNMQDVQHTPGNPAIAAAMGSRTGGARPSALTTNSEALKALLSNPQIQAPTFTPAALPELSKAGLLEKVGGGAGVVGGILSALGGLSKQQPQLQGRRVAGASQTYNTPPFV